MRKFGTKSGRVTRVNRCKTLRAGWECLGDSREGNHVHTKPTGESADEKIHQANLQRGIPADVLLEEVRAEREAARQKAVEDKAAQAAMTIPGSRVMPLRVDPAFRPSQ